MAKSLKFPTKTSAVYDEKSVTAFVKDTDKIRAKPQLYIGPTDSTGVYTILRECCDNSVDEARAGRNTQLDIWVMADGSFTVADKGVGIPVKKHAVMKISTLTHVLTNLQSSGKMKKGAYDSAIGTHGVGIKATNALSEQFQVWTYRADAGGWHSTSFAKGREKAAVAKAKAPKLPDGKVPKSGTVIRFVPDSEVFNVKRKAGAVWFATEMLHTWAELSAYMNPGLTINVHVQKKNDSYVTKAYYSKDGIVSYLAKRIIDLKATPLSKKPVIHNSQTLELALHFADVEGSEVEYFTNTIRNVEQGVHARAVNRALVTALKPFRGRLEYTPTDLQEGLVGVVNYKINAPQFDSQTKEKLVDVRVEKPCYEEALTVLSEYFNANKTLAKQIVQRAAELRKKTQEFLKDKKLLKSVKSARSTLAAKLADVESGTKVPMSERELYIVEGDSAGGTAKKARVKDRQAVWPIRGKILNVMRKSKERVSSSPDVAGIFAALGLDLGAKDPLANLRFGRVILMADPDTDGSHISCLLLSLFWLYTPDLFRRGQIFVLVAPEFLARHRGKVYFGMTKEDLYAKCKSDQVVAQHIKGWGEIDAADLFDAGMSLETRRLWRILPPKTKDGLHNFTLLMSEDTTYRKNMLGIKL